MIRVEPRESKRVALDDLDLLIMIRIVISLHSFLSSFLPLYFSSTSSLLLHHLSSLPFLLLPSLHFSSLLLFSSSQMWHKETPVVDSHDVSTDLSLEIPPVSLPLSLPLASLSPGTTQIRTRSATLMLLAFGLHLHVVVMANELSLVLRAIRGGDFLIIFHHVLITAWVFW